MCDIDWLSGYLANEHYSIVKQLHNRFGYHIINVNKLSFSLMETVNDLNTYDALFVCYQGMVAVPIDRITALKYSV